LLIYEDKNYALRNFGVSITSDEKFAILTTSQGTSGNLLALADVSKWDVKSPIQFNLFNKDFSADYWYVGQIKSGLLFITNHQAPNKKLVLINPKKNKPDVWQVLIPESDHVLENVYVTKSGLIVKYMIDVRSALFVYNFSGKREQEIQLPVTGNIISVQTTPDKDEFYYSIVSYTFPARIYKSSVNHLKSELYFKPAIKFDSDNFVTKQVFYYSKDSTKIPMFITHRKDLQLNGDNPCFLFGYGGFNISYTPEFRVDRSVFLENGGIYCVANIRGGGEYGKRWHNAGRQLNKQNVFNDFIAAAEYLIKEKYTNTHKLAIHGRSNGGLLAAACLTQRPDLFKVVIPQVGVLDMLKFHKFTIGWAWVGDYGSSENKEHFEYLLKYSPVHNVKPNHYPATLVVTADHDDRVVPAHSYKFIAQLQDKQLSDNPALIRIDTNGGHGSGKPLAMQIDEYGDMWSFVFYNLGMSIN
jgi:prolyl oligopeptidase